MPLRDIQISCSAAVTSSQTQRIFSLALQNVTDFSGYTADPILGSYLTAGNTISVTALGDNMPVTVIRELNPGTANAISTFLIGNIYYTVANRNSTYGCFILPSLDPNTGYLPDLVTSGGTSVAVNLSTLNTSDDIRFGILLKEVASNLGFTVAVSPGWSIRIADSYIAVVSSLTGGPRVTMYAKHADSLAMVVMQDVYYGTNSSYQSIGTAICRNPAPLDKTYLNSATLVTNFGPVVTDLKYSGHLRPANSTVTTAFNRKKLPPFIQDPVSGLDVKPVFQFKIYDAYTDTAIDISDTHSVLITAYATGDDRKATVLNNGITYKAYANLLFAI